MIYDTKFKELSMIDIIKDRDMGSKQAARLTKEQAEALHRWLNSEGTIEDREVLVKLLGV